MNFKGKTDLIRKIIMLKKTNRSIQVLLNDFLFFIIKKHRTTVLHYKV